MFVPLLGYDKFRMRCVQVVWYYDIGVDILGPVVCVQDGGRHTVTRCQNRRLSFQHCLHGHWERTRLCILLRTPMFRGPWHVMQCLRTGMLSERARWQNWRLYIRKQTTYFRPFNHVSTHEIWYKGCTFENTVTDLDLFSLYFAGPLFHAIEYYSDFFLFTFRSCAVSRLR